MANESSLTLALRLSDKVSGPLEKLNGRLKAMNAPANRIGSAFKDLGKQSGLTAIGASLKNVGSEAFGLAAGLTASAAAAGFAAFAIVKGAVDAGDKLAEMADRVGLSVDAYAQLGFAAAQADIDQEQFNASMDQFNKRLGQAKQGLGPLKALGPVFFNQLKGAKDTETAFGLAVKAIGKMKSPAEKAALAAEFFGKSGLQMGIFLGQGTEEIEKQRKKFFELAGAQEEFARGAGGVDNAMREAEVAFLGARNALATALFPAITQLSGAVSGFLAKNRDGLKLWAEKTGKALTAWIEGGGIQRLSDGLSNMATSIGKAVDKLGGLENVGLIAAAVMAGPFALSVLTLGGHLASFSMLLLGPVLASLGTFATAITVGMTAMDALNLTMMMNPVGLVIAGFAALGAAAYVVWKNWEPIKAFFEELWETMKKVATAFVGGNWKGGGETKGFREVYDPSAPGGVRREALRPTFNAVAAMPQAGASAQEPGRLQVDFANVPKGVKVTPDKGTDWVDLDLGYSMGGQ